MESHGFNTMRFQVYLKNLLEKREKEELLKKLEEADSDLKKCQTKKSQSNHPLPLQGSHIIVPEIPDSAFTICFGKNKAE
ncbi:hypothetical protein LIER_41172 [Lithospermum erythrorhizon]|uniref:Uncharacterized protein n=1 Tax=Lithospermum erythrorhizon TaxID=34254 RepID=A0AAV3R953_LITER